MNVENIWIMEYIIYILIAVLLAFAGGLLPSKKRNRRAGIPYRMYRADMQDDVTSAVNRPDVESGYDAGVNGSDEAAGIRVVREEPVLPVDSPVKEKDAGKGKTCTSAELKKDARRLVLYPEIMKPKYKEF